MELAGTSDNVITGTVTVVQGTLALNKDRSGAATPMPFNNAIVRVATPPAPEKKEPRSSFPAMVAAGLAPTGDDVAATKALRARLRALLAIAGMPANLAACGVDAAAIPELARDAAGQWTGKFNPRQVGEHDFVRLYHSALTGEAA